MSQEELARATQDPAIRRARAQELVRAHYEGASEIYRTLWGESYHFALFAANEPRADALIATERLIAELAGFSAGMRLLDLGCGIGGPALTIAEHTGAHVTGVDLVPEHIARARERAASRGLAGAARFVEGDVLTLPFADGAFDGVYSFECGCHVPRKPELYRECARVLRPGGAFTGLDWLRSAAPAGRRDEQLIESICRHFALPEMIALEDLRRALEGSGLDVQVVREAAALGSLAPNWDPFEPSSQSRLAALGDRAGMAALERLAAGGRALAQAASSGAFLVGYWLARKPVSAGDCSVRAP